MMKPAKRNQRLLLLGAGAVLIVSAAALTFSALDQNIAYFYTPSEVDVAELSAGQRIRLGGLVAPGSIKSESGVVTDFLVTDGAAEVKVRYSGILPDLFREGQGVIAQGRFGGDSVFVADTILAKHDENYVPKELKDVVEANHARD